MKPSTLRDEFQELAAALLTAGRTRALYPEGHHQVQAALRDCHECLRRILDEHRRVRVVLADEEFIVGTTQIPIRNQVLEGFAGALRRAGIGRIHFMEGILQWELERFLSLLFTDSATLEARGGVSAVLAHEGVEHLTAGPLTVAGETEEERDGLVRAWEVYSSGIRTVRQVRQAARARGRIEHLDETRDLARKLVDVAEEEAQPLLTLHALKVHDDYSFTHSVNVAILSLVLARALDFPAQALHEITLAALLHDIGKERVPKEILNKPGKLSAEEWEVMERHGPEGTKMLATAEGVGDLAVIVAYEHHLGYDHRHPDHGKWPLHIASQIVCIADVYDALRSVRPYRGELPPDVAMQIMQEDAPQKFDLDLFEGFSRLVGFYPPGTCVRLENGAVGVVRRSNPSNPRAPRVRVVLDPEGRSLAEAEEVDLAAEAGGMARFGAIREVIDGAAVGIDSFDHL